MAVRLDVRDLEERLVREANEVYGATHPRPVHVDLPLPGSAGEALARHLPAFQAEKAGSDDEMRALRAVVAGEAPPSALPARYAAALERLRPDLDGLLAGARAERADFPEGGDPTQPMEGADWAAFQQATRLAAAGLRLALAAGDRRRAPAAACRSRRRAARGRASPARRRRAPLRGPRAGTRPRGGPATCPVSPGRPARTPRHPPVPRGAGRSGAGRGRGGRETRRPAVGGRRAPDRRAGERRMTGPEPRRRALQSGGLCATAVAGAARSPTARRSPAAPPPATAPR